MNNLIMAAALLSATALAPDDDVWHFVPQPGEVQTIKNGMSGVLCLTASDSLSVGEIVDKVDRHKPLTIIEAHMHMVEMTESGRCIQIQEGDEITFLSIVDHNDLNTNVWEVSLKRDEKLDQRHLYIDADKDGGAELEPQ